MEKVSAAQFKANFSEFLDKVRQGKTIAIFNRRTKKTVAVLAPPKDRTKRKRSIGLLKIKATFEIGPGFKMIEEEFLAG